ncbi:MAG: PIN domain-containing protein [Comamonas sp.]|uniref:PIN-like domain-containing protein n=1 Tax=Comamonas sp. TaxID=34028 RepID=UPI002822DF52|nr:PIN-like domain-containing protein [Comamonas sp.]MDR0216774.1 PIN domain-containing protein [Comamonas sp.]
MKNKFPWYFSAEEKEINDIWSTGCLTVDANVLLDLYRYNPRTREDIINALATFKGERWLTYQTAEEFLRNRKKVIVEANSDYENARKQVGEIKKKLEDAASKISSYRLIPNSIGENLKNKIDAVIEDNLSEIENAEKSHPKFLSDDEVLRTIEGIFSQPVGDEPSAEKMDSWKAEASRRIEQQIPPGYKDNNKDGDEKYGDYLFWAQVLEHANTKKQPIVLVTSETKEDWWEKHSGKTVGPRKELLKEIFDFSGQRVLIYQTHNFLKYSADRNKTNVSEKTLAEIKSVNEQVNRGPAVRIVEHSHRIAGDLESSGMLKVELRRPLPFFTASGAFLFEMIGVPKLEAKVLSFPSDMPEKYKTGAGTGTTFDFNIHMSSSVSSQPLPAGIYEFEYFAVSDECPNIDNLYDFGKEDNNSELIRSSIG